MVVEARRDELIARYAVPVFEVESVNGYGGRITGWVEAMRQEKWVTTVSVNENTARIVVNNVEVAQRELLASAVATGLVLTRYEMLRPSLEDVFLQLVGEGAQA
jgi:ABC-type uncharacterized transport system ATPase subunit